MIRHGSYSNQIPMKHKLKYNVIVIKHNFQSINKCPCVIVMLTYMIKPKSLHY